MLNSTSALRIVLFIVSMPGPVSHILSLPLPPTLICTCTDLPEGGKAAVYEALNRRAQAEALVGCDDVTSNLLYRQAASMSSNSYYIIHLYITSKK